MITRDVNGNIVIISRHADAEAHLQRLKSILSLVQQRSSDFTDADCIYHALDLMEDMLPDEEQMQKALK